MKKLIMFLLLINLLGCEQKQTNENLFLKKEHLKHPVSDKFRVMQMIKFDDNNNVYSLITNIVVNNDDYFPETKAGRSEYVKKDSTLFDKKEEALKWANQTIILLEKFYNIKK
jgi:hypothetical protein